MTKKQKKELRELQSTRQLMGISQLTGHGLHTAAGELAFFLVQPDNLSVLSEEGVRSRVVALTNLLRGLEEVRLMALDSRESFQNNKRHYQARLEQEELPAIRELLRCDCGHLDEIQSATASAREFALVFRLDKGGEDAAGLLPRLEKRIRDQGFRVRPAESQDMMRLLAVYYAQDTVTEFFDDIDGERWAEHG